MVSFNIVFLAPDANLNRVIAITLINKISLTIIGNSFIDRSAARARVIIRTTLVIRFYTTGTSLSKDLYSI